MKHSIARATRTFSALGAACIVTASSAGACGGSSDDPPATDGGSGDDGPIPQSDAGTSESGVVADSSLVDGKPGDADPPPVDSHAPDVDAAPPPITYTNPVVAHDFPDPFVLVDTNAYYAFATNRGATNVQAAKSIDLATWTDLPDALPTLPSWAAKNAGLTWAPSVLKRGNSYVLYYTARDVASGFQCVSRATSAKPEGPYVDSSSAPFVCQVAAPQKFCGSIDPSPFVDTNGDAYLVWKSDENAGACQTAPRLWSALLSADGLSLTSAPTTLLAMDQPWEQPIIEGPTMTVHAGVYFLFYSANAYESASYSMGYATCLSAAGPCKKVTVAGPLIQSATTALGPGGGEFFTDHDGREWLAYHAWTDPKTTYASGGARSFRIDRIHFDTGAPLFDGPSTTPRVQ